MVIYSYYYSGIREARQKLDPYYHSQLYIHGDEQVSLSSYATLGKRVLNERVFGTNRIQNICVLYEKIIGQANGLADKIDTLHERVQALSPKSMPLFTLFDPENVNQDFVAAQKDLESAWAEWRELEQDLVCIGKIIEYNRGAFDQYAPEASKQQYAQFQKIQEFIDVKFDEFII